MIKIAATASFGIESIVAEELKNLGYDNLKIDNGKIIFDGNFFDVCISNIFLRTAERVLIILKEFKAQTFDDLFEGIYDYNWEDILPVDANIYVKGRSYKSKLFSVKDCQAITKKAIIERLKKKYKKDWFEETGELYPFEIMLNKDIATIVLDTSGEGLHKRGYRKYINQAPLKETIAASMIMLSRWRKKEEALWDPFCGTGTIPIEACLMAKNIAPGLNRSFIAEKWGLIPEKDWERARIFAMQAVDNSSKPHIIASDIDKEALSASQKNAKIAGVLKDIAFMNKDATKIEKIADKGIIVTNPPYGQRMIPEELSKLYKNFGQALKKFDNWRFFILSGYEQFEKAFGMKAKRNRKLYNGDIKTYLYFYI